ncbi:TolC family outer membrane protein [Celeribacter marinus]|uniref:Type I secretion outer membrane protein, TolC n=1 Tax=Celeribacter marinus TaxID=1397108 RepID=A0A0N7HIY5_9RHOB|nr:TolC family outer membrane protein [Celeribacter marinus]ALI56517.1 type I secretion outer membrane protein, TolC precursor [Celeribacter marinus]SFK40908.1 outer membrane protein [Celeribacter marinus]
MTTKNTFKLRAFAALVAAGLGVAAPLSVSAESLGDALASAYKNSGLLEQNRATLRATDEGVATALASLRPTIGYSAGSDYSFTNKAWMTQLGFNASMTLYTFGKNKVSVDIAKETVLATREALINVEQQVLASAVATYMNVREQEALVNLRNSAVRLATQNLRATRDRFEVGEVTRTQVSQFEAQLASVRAQLASAQGTLAAARESYKNQMGHYPSNLSSPPSVKLPVKSADAAVRLAHRTHPGIKALQHQVSAADLAVDGTERNLFPEISASAGWSVNDNPATSRIGKSIGISASGPIYSGGAISSAIRKTIAQRDQSRAELLTATRDVEEGVRSNWAMLSVLRASLNASQAFVSAQRVAYNGVREEADLGASTALDVLDAEQDLLDAQVSAIQAQIASETQTYNVLQSMGLLTVQNLNLNVPVYDPAAYYNAVKTGPTSYVSPEGAKLDRVLESLGRK